MLDSSLRTISRGKPAIWVTRRQLSLGEAGEVAAIRQRLGVGASQRLAAQAQRGQSGKVRRAHEFIDESLGPVQVDVL